MQNFSNDGYNYRYYSCRLVVAWYNILNVFIYLLISYVFLTA